MERVGSTAFAARVELRSETQVQPPTRLEGASIRSPSLYGS